MKGSRQVVESLQRHVKENGLQDQVELGGAFCIGNCQNGVSVTVDGAVHSVNPDNVDSFFENEIKSKV